MTPAVYPKSVGAGGIDVALGDLGFLAIGLFELGYVGVGLAEVEALHLVAAPLRSKAAWPRSRRLRRMVTCSDWPRPTMRDTMAEVCAAGAERIDERAVDLDLVEREAVQIATGSNSRCRNRPSRSARRAASRLVQRVERRVGVLEQDAFGDLELEPLRLEPGLASARRTISTDAGLLELHRRDVDGDA